MYALVILLLTHNPGNVDRPVELKFLIEAHRTEQACEESIVLKLSELPKDIKIGGIRSACVRLGAETKGT